MRPDSEIEPLLTPAEVAHMFRVDPKTVTRWASAGRLSSIRTLGGHRRFRSAEVYALLNGGAPPMFQVRYWTPETLGGRLSAIYGTYGSAEAATRGLAGAVKDRLDRPWLVRWDVDARQWRQVRDAS